MAFKTALVTGGTRGVGKELVKMFLNRNINVVMTGRNLENVKEIESKINNSHTTNKAHVTGYKLDFTDLNGSRKILNKLEDKEIKPTYLINNAGVIRDRSFMKMSEEEWNTVININLTGMFIVLIYSIPFFSNDFFRIWSI